jgi:ribosomal protein S27AE
VTRRSHIHAIAALVVARLEASQPQLSRRLLCPQVRWVAQELDESLARHLGVIDLVERCRSEHLATLDADQGLATLTVSWQEVVVRADGMLGTRRRSSCSRCGARARQRGHRCGRCGLVAPRPSTRP